MARLEESDKETDEEIEKENRQEQVKKHKHSTREAKVKKENRVPAAFHSPMLPSPVITPPLTQATTKMSFETPTRPSSAQSRKIGHAIRTSIADRTLQAYKSSAFASGRSTPARSLDIDIKDIKPEIDSLRARGIRQTPSWINEDSPLPVVRNAAQTDKIAADFRMDRLATWMQNVEKVVEDACQNFAASAKVEAPLPSLPAAPRNSLHNHSTRSLRPPRKVVAAAEIFAEYNNSLKADTSHSADTSVVGNSEPSSNQGVSHTPSGASSSSILSPPTSATPSQNQLIVRKNHTPSPKRRATVSEDSPIAIHKDAEMSPSKRRDKTRSHGNLLQQRIASLTQLEAEFNKPTPPGPSRRLSEMFDRSIFIATPLRPHEDLDSSSDELGSSFYHVLPYPQREVSAQDAPPPQRQLEGVYDRFLMATSGVKRLGKGYQSTFISPPPNSASSSGSFNTTINRKQSRVFFGGSKTPMLPPVSSEDVKRSTSVDEMGVLSHNSDMGKEESYHKVSFMKKAIKAMVPSTKHSRRLSKMVVT
ncbi:hypothetical protein AGABI2DRAFT_193680 [Agaricus bisporus var. bisporus H97]|uniref:hypothetical protein n=1 Tax=Agaricus bisporus var. bisporus (strain H97 / ATCC MYA-4626 / FGSC 10389) TaxID=936046 RepID=UPI00029F4F03|nr:hypothetical protein AGABI2DRAFT_193680 [Agaricus bisporus var. bisporus H97]EKV45741.1 hypothetical protein AGABI2DRAFT_193680 [Agaricus bisporus var. bisporus H97]